ncbi:MAG: T9SS type A sorting domain-containing protein [Flavobacteriales bacterium]|nr:T9SS type A sorting domain-containing protein [Flavobacteriales bacterium]
MIIVEFCSGLDEVGSRELSVAPNPFTDLFVLRAEGGPILRVEVLDASGRKVLDQRPGADQCAMDLGAAPAGMYTLRVITSFGMQHLRLVKQ